MVELMVAVTISMILLAGVTQIFISSKAAYTLQGSASELNENARYALSRLSYDIRMAGHWGGLQSDDISGSPAITSGLNGQCTLAWLYDTATPIRGYEGGPSPPLNCIAAANYVANSDVIFLKFADSNPIKKPDSGEDAKKIYLRSSVGQRGMFATGTEINNNATGIVDADGTYNYLYRPVLYFIQPCSERGASNTCTNAKDQIPTLVRVTLYGNQFKAEPLIQGIEQLQFAYGVDTSSPGDLVVDRYVTAAEIDADAALDWDDVLAVRVDLIARSLERDNGFKDTKTYAMAGGFSYDNQDYKGDENYLRRYLSATFQVRNQLLQ